MELVLRSFKDQMEECLIDDIVQNSNCFMSFSKMWQNPALRDWYYQMASIYLVLTKSFLNKNTFNLQNYEKMKFLGNCGRRIRREKNL
jgi:hypothetical protein